jgi:hypothetical protein
VQLFSVAHVRPGFAADFFDRASIKAANNL